MKFFGKIILFLIFLFIFWIFNLSFVYAVEEKSVLINEVMWMGSTASSSDEWIELKNNSNEEIDISDWIVENAGSAGKSLTIPLAKTIVPGGYFLIAKYSFINNPEKTVLANETDWVTADLSLANSGNGNLVLKDSNGLVIDQAKGDAWPAGNNDKKYSMERLTGSNEGLLASSWQTAREAKGFKTESKERGSPGHGNSPLLFSSPGSYPLSVTKYILLNRVVKAEVEVIKIIDGDTIEVLLDEENIKVRLLGINTPESAMSGEFDVEEPYYKEAKDFAQNNLLNKQVDLLISQNPADQYDAYDRLLAAVIIDNEVFNIKIIAQGLARTYYLENEIINFQQWLEEEQIAQNNHYNIWKSLNESDVVINEFIPNPEGSDSKNEWIELYNQGNNSVDLSNWFLDDAEHGSKPYLLPQNTIIKDLGYLVISIIDSKIVLNNNGDSVRLFRPDLTLVQRVDYKEKVKEGYSYNRLTDGSWQWSSTSTPGKENIIVNENSSDNKGGFNSLLSSVFSIAQARGQPSGTQITVVGYVNVPPNVLSSQYFYIQDNEAGMQIYCYYKDFPDLRVDDKIRVTGELSLTIYGARIKIKKASDIQILERDQIVLPTKLKTGQIGEEWEGRLVRIRGTVVETSGDIFYLDDGTGRVKVYIKDSTGIVKPRFRKGIVVEIIGIVTRYKDEWRAQLRFQSDLMIVDDLKKKDDENKIIETVMAAEVANDSQGKILGWFSKAKEVDQATILRQQGLIWFLEVVIIICSILLVLLIGEKYVRKRNRY